MYYSKLIIYRHNKHLFNIFLGLLRRSANRTSRNDRVLKISRYTSLRGETEFRRGNPKTYKLLRRDSYTC